MPPHSFFWPTYSEPKSCRFSPCGLWRTAKFVLFQFGALFSDLEDSIIQYFNKGFPFISWFPNPLTVVIEDCINFGANSWEVCSNQLGITRVQELSPLVIPEQRNNQHKLHQNMDFMTLSLIFHGYESQNLPYSLLKEFKLYP